LAALVIGVLADVAGERLGAPALAVATSAIVPLLPGLAIYRALYSMVNDDAVTGLTQLLGAVGIGLGLASGVALGSYVARPLRQETDRWERRVRGYAQGRRD
ncbi:MAG TPA: threonine/serine exporter family protein, partial [Mycobacteriales bacterium]|nr:threonine/serine exporter family protein [Mycobacteriales bacterium]